MTKPLATAAEVIEALGGPAATARLTGRKAQHVWNWKNSDRLPAETFLVISSELEALGKSAPPSLWGIAVPADSKVGG